MRVAAVGDVHVGVDGRGALRQELVDVSGDADVLLVAGDFTRHGSVAEAEVAAQEFADLGLPVLAVLGNHDYHAGASAAVAGALAAAGIWVLDGSAEVVQVGATRVGVAGVKGFGGGFAGASGSDFGEQEMKDFVSYSRSEAQRLDRALSTLEADVRLVLTHYAPVPDTLVGERLEIYPFLGSYLLEQVIDRHQISLAVHGHAHLGCEAGMTAGGVPVRNVARAVLDRPYAVYSVDP
ncbi:MAG: metallophosphoesterase [Actinomycetota bacterium]|nr:metallophosphoesterase [Actinomycetota bacterium]